MSNDRMRTIQKADALADGRLRLSWSDGVEALLTLPDELVRAGTPKIGDWGHSLEWPNGEEMGADRLWLETLTALGRADSRAFLEWRMRNNLSLQKAGDALGLARRTVAYYSNGDRPVPKSILLACKGWEAGDALLIAA